MQLLFSLSCEDLEQLHHYPRGIVVACSGGRDSVVLLHQLATLHAAGKISGELRVCHVNLHLRGEQSTEDEKWVQELAARWNLRFHPYHPTSLPTPSTEQHSPRACQEHAAEGSLQAEGSSVAEGSVAKGSPELWARQVRRRAYLWWCSEGYAVALAHHRDDAVETILFRAIRGSQPWNLAGLKRWREGLFRPLLNIPGSRILLYAQHHKLSWREDSSNRDVSFARNKLRHVILPELKHIHSQTGTSLLHIAQQSEAMAQFLRHFFEQQKEGPTLRVNKIAHLSSAVVQLALEALAGEKLKLTSGLLKEIIRTLKAAESDRCRSPYTFSLPQGILYIHKGRVRMERGFFPSTTCVHHLRAGMRLTLQWPAACHPTQQQGALEMRCHEGAGCITTQLWELFVVEAAKSARLQEPHPSRWETLKKFIESQEFLFSPQRTWIVSLEEDSKETLLLGAWTEWGYYPLHLAAESNHRSERTCDHNFLKQHAAKWQLLWISPQQHLKASSDHQASNKIKSK